MTESYASGNWHLQQGKEDEFIQRWTEFLEGTRNEHPALVSAQLIRDEADTAHFLSVSQWESTEAREAWKQSAGFQERFQACRALTDQFESSDYSPAVSL
ncbi:MAG: antibiotic biosynthesis monooxygenase family protein [Actinomycetota bacterium]